MAQKMIQADEGINLMQNLGILLYMSIKKKWESINFFNIY